MKKIFSLILTIWTTASFAQSVTTGIPDSVQNVNYPGSTGQYTISNPLDHNGAQFTNPPITFGCAMNCISDYLYFYDLGLNIPAGSTISGIEIIHTRGGCNGGSYDIDSLQLAYNAAIISFPKRDSTSGVYTDTLGSSTDNWSAVLTPAIVNDNSFGVFINSTSTGICTFGQFDLRVNVYYDEPSKINQLLSEKNGFEIYPNPADDNFQIKFNTKINDGTLNIFNAFGAKVLEQRVTRPIQQINLKDIPAGIYFVKVHDDSKCYCRKLVIGHD